MSFNALHMSCSARRSGLTESEITKGVPREIQGQDLDFRLKGFLVGWKLALNNANQDDWKMVVNSYSLLKRELCVFPVEVDNIFSASVGGDLVGFIRGQQHLKNAMSSIIQAHLDKK